MLSHIENIELLQIENHDTNVKIKNMKNNMIGKKRRKKERKRHTYTNGRCCTDNIFSLQTSPITWLEQDQLQELQIKSSCMRNQEVETNLDQVRREEH
mmetsp:Transcript_28529/g.37325  ORF Transcript_28529/g.37325 Transcript_28529/m.37325 type:complete len:98 (-) Transcript_28529:1262-1555(-)